MLSSLRRSFLSLFLFFPLTNDRMECSTGSVQLVGGKSESEGRIEVCLNGRWGTVCDNGWDNQDVQVVCRQLGFSKSHGEQWYRQTN